VASELKVTSPEVVRMLWEMADAILLAPDEAPPAETCGNQAEDWEALFPPLPDTNLKEVA
jgi:hypothetical protein